MNADTVKAALDKAANDPQNSWTILSSVIVNLATDLDQARANHDKLLAGTKKLAMESRGMREALAQLIGGVEGGGGEAQVAPSGDAPVMGADGAPITDPTQLAAEAAMMMAAGPRDGETAPPPQNALVPRRQGRPQPQRRPQAGGGGAPKQRVGADGAPITDPTQLAAEEAMDAAMGGSGSEE